MGKKYSVGDKVVTADNWNDGMGRIIPKGSVVEIIRDFEYGGINMYDCEYNGGRCIYEEQWLGDKYVNPKIGGWIPCSERLPKEHDSIFAQFKDTDQWSGAMFEKISDDVNVTVEFENGKRKTKTLHTIDGKWSEGNRGVKFKVIAWQPLPEEYHE